MAALPKNTKQAAYGRPEKCFYREILTLPQVRHAPFVGLHADSFPVPSRRPHPACRCEPPGSYQTDSTHMDSGHAGSYPTSTIARNNPRQSELWNPTRSAIPQVRLHLIADEAAVPEDAQK